MEDYNRKEPKYGTITKKGLEVGRGNNKKVIPVDEVVKLARLHCTYKEMADFFEVPVETLKYNFRDLILKYKAETKQSLRKAQIKSALEGNSAMLIWLGKNMLGQSDNGERDSDDKQVLPWVD